MSTSKNTMVEIMKDMLIAMYGQETAAKMMSAPPPPPRTNLPISPRENMKLLLEHKQPRYMPTGADTVAIMPDVVRERTPDNKSGEDWFGVKWTFGEKGGAPMVKPGTEICHDVTKWRESIKIPDLDAIDWESSAKEMEPFYHPDKMSSFWILNGPFERLHSIIGIEDAFMSFYDEPEAVHDFMEFITEFKIKLLGKLIDHYKVDIILFHDDWGSGQNGFFSEDIFREFIYPYMKRIVQYVKSRNVYFDLHSDGKIQMYMPYILDMGCDMWNPAQCCNDLEMIKEKYGDKLVLSGGMDDYFLDSPKITEEEIRSYVRRKLDVLARGGGYLPKPNAKSLKSSAIMADELAKYSKNFYNENK